MWNLSGHLERFFKVVNPERGVVNLVLEAPCLDVNPGGKRSKGFILPVTKIVRRRGKADTRTRHTRHCVLSEIPRVKHSLLLRDSRLVTNSVV